MITFLTFITSFALTLLILPLIRRFALKIGCLDYPGGRKIHDSATPLLGGVGIYVGLLVGMPLFSQAFPAFFPFFIGATAIFILGLFEDLRGLSALSRFLVQSAVALFLVLTGLKVSFLPANLLGSLGEAVITVIWIVGVTNAYNYLDGLDGLCAGSAAINFFFFSIFLYSTGQFEIGLLCVSLIAACLAFLPFNFSRSKIFLGEAGSTLLGFCLAGIALRGSWATDDKNVKLLIPVLILGVPIFDMIFTTIMRVKEGKVRTIVEWLKYGGKDHFHHYLVDLGLSTRKAVAYIYSITFFLGISALLLGRTDYLMKACLSLLQASIIFSGIATLIVVGKRRQSGWKNG